LQNREVVAQKVVPKNEVGNRGNVVHLRQCIFWRRLSTCFKNLVVEDSPDVMDFFTFD
jgi:hypothetical protein